MKKLLVTGVSGFLGSHFLELKSEEYQIFGTFNNNSLTEPNTFKINLCDDSQTAALIRQIKPHAILHLAANSDPNYCELNPKETYDINVLVAVNLAKIAKENNIQFLFTSTDLVYDGENAPYLETDTTNPIMEYGRQKLEAEEQILLVNPNAIIARMPLMFGESKHGSSFYTNWLDKLKTGKPLYAFTDEYRTPISVETAANGLLNLVNSNVTGVFNLGGNESISRYDFAFQISHLYNIPNSNIIACKRADVNMPAKRPRNVSVNSCKAQALGYKVGSLKDEIKQYIV